MSSTTDPAEDRAAFVKRTIAEMRDRHIWPANQPGFPKTAPADPEVRRDWATKKAADMGWLLKRA